MSSAGLVIMIYIGMGVIFLGLVIFYLIKRIKDSKKEKFERRDN